MPTSTDYFKKSRRKFTTRVATAGCLAADTTIPLDSVSGLDTDTGIIIVIDAVDNQGNATPDKEEVIAGVVSGSTIITAIRGMETTTAQDHSGGAIVTMYFTESHWDSLVNGLLVEHTQAGTHNFGAGTLLTSPIIKGEATVALADAATIATDASLGNIFTVTLGGNRTMGAPTNPTNGQKIIYRLKQDGTGTRTMTWNAVFRFSTDVPVPTLTTTINKTDYVGFVYNSTDTKWDALAVSKGY